MNKRLFGGAKLGDIAKTVRDRADATPVTAERPTSQAVLPTALKVKKNVPELTPICPDQRCPRPRLCA